MHPIDEIIELVRTIHERAFHLGVTDETMSVWEICMLRICNGYDNQRALSTFAPSVIESFLEEVQRMEAQLVIDPHLVGNLRLIHSQRLLWSLTIWLSGVGG